MLCVGEKMVCNKPIVNIKNQVLLNNNDEFEVVSFVLKQEKRAYDFWYYSVDIINDGRKLTINILAEKSFDSFAKEVKRLKTIAEKAKVMTKRNAWSKYYKLLERYADVNYNYALTIHKSQGSTFDNVIVINCDIERVPNVIERNKLLYTAITRAKNKLFII
jgi:exodeoxyribonuclease-5